MNKKTFNSLPLLFIILMSAVSCKEMQKSTPSSSPQTHHVQVVGVEINGTKFWIPSHLTAKKGDTLKIKLISKIGGTNNIHGYKIADFNVEALVDEKGTEIEFLANKSGIFPIFCHLHPTHIGGQLTVLE